MVVITLGVIFYRGDKEVLYLPSTEECTCFCHKEHEQEIEKIQEERRFLLEEKRIESDLLMQKQSKFCSAPFLKNLEELKY